MLTPVSGSIPGYIHLCQAFLTVMATENDVENVQVSRYGCIAQRVDRLALNQKVSGSNPATSNFLQCLYLLFICLWFGICHLGVEERGDFFENNIVNYG